MQWISVTRNFYAKTFQLAIPNREIRELFIDQVTEWFEQASGKDAPKLDAFCEAFPDGNPETIEQLLNDYLWDTISIRDMAVKAKKENFYHGILLGFLRHKEQWLVQSNIFLNDRGMK